MMTRPFRMMGILFLTSLGLAQAQETARIARVTLYPGAATVERVAQVAAGAAKLEVANLPANFDVRTIRVEADSGIRLGEFTVRDVARAEAVNPRQAELEAKILALGDQIAILDIERQAAELVTGYLKGLGEPVEGSVRAAADPRGLAATLEAIRHGGTEALIRVQKVAVQKRDLERQKAALQTELGKVAERNRDSRSLVLVLAADRAGEVRIAYQVNGPGWQPVYRATLDSAGSTVELERQALIAQNSGEDWNNVALRLSTGQPRSAPQGQPPRAWELRLREPQPVMAKAMAMPAAAPAPMPVGAARAGEPLFNVTELQGTFATEFEVPAKVSLPSDGRKITVQLSRQNLPVALRVQAVPRQDASAFVVARAERPQGVWLPGEIQLYRDGAYIGATRWDPQSGERLELPFGRDDLIRISVAHPRQMSGSSGLIEQRKDRQIADVYTVTNQHRQPVELLLLEPSPVTTSEQIKVETRFEPKPAKENWDDRPGVVAWEQPLAAGTTQKFSVDYRISWPREASVIGLP